MMGGQFLWEGIMARIRQSLLVILIAAGLGNGCAAHRAGRQWVDHGSGLPEYYGVTAFSISTQASDLIWMTTYQPDGVYYSTDGGENWSPRNTGLDGDTPLAVLALPDGSVYLGSYAGVSRLAADDVWVLLDDLPNAPAYALAASPAGDTVAAGFESQGIFRSQDGGSSWQRAGPAGATVLSLAVDAVGTIYAGMAEQGIWALPAGAAEPHSVTLPAEALQAYVPRLVVRSDDSLLALIDGRLWLLDPASGAWTAIGPGGASMFGLSRWPEGGILLVAAGGELWRSREVGGEWEQMGNALQKSDVTCLEVDPTRPGVAYIGTLWHGAHRTSDAGQTWIPVGSGIGRRLVTSLAVDLEDARRMFVGTVDGVYCSTDGAQSWQICSAALRNTLIQDVVVDPDRPDRLVAGAHDGLYESTDAGTTWARLTEDLGAVAIFDVLIHDGTTYAGAWGHNVLRVAAEGGAPVPVHGGLETQSIYSLAIDPTDSGTLYAGAVECVFKSTDGGESWRAVTAGWPGALTAFSLAIDPAHSSRLLAGTTRGVYVSNDAGETWDAASAVLYDLTITALLWATTPAGEEVYAGAEHGGLYISVDGGAAWESVGLDGRSVYGLYRDPASGVLWATTDDSLYSLAP